MNIIKKIETFNTKLKKRIIFLLECWGIVPEPDDLEVQIVRRIARSKEEFEKLKADLESQGYEVNIQEFYEEKTDRKNFFASILAEKEMPEKKIQKLPLKKHTKLLRKKEMVANIVMRTMWAIFIAIVLIIYLIIIHPFLLAILAVIRM